MKLIFFFTGLILIQSLFGQQIVNEKKIRIKDHKAYNGNVPYTGATYGSGFPRYYKNGFRDGEFMEDHYSVSYKINRATSFKYYSTNKAVIFSIDIDSIHKDATNVKFGIVGKGEWNDTLKLLSSVVLKPALIIQYDYTRYDTVYLDNFTFKGYTIELSLKGHNRNLFCQNNSLSPNFVGKLAKDVWCLILFNESKFKKIDIELPEKRLFLK